jgi:hypothetical protein
MSEPPNLERLARPLARLLRVPEERLPGCLVAAAEADLASVLRLRRDVIGAALEWDDEAYLRWRYVLDGGGVAALEDRRPASRLWLFKRDDEVLGCLGAENVELATPRGAEPALRFMDLMVAPRMNGLGIGAWLNLMLLRHVQVGISVGGSDQSIDMIGRLFRRLPDRKVWSLPLRSGPLLASRWPSTRRLPVVSQAIDLLLAGSRRLARLAQGLRVELSQQPRPDRSMRALGDSMVEAGMTMVRRTEEGWCWRYLENPRRSYEFHTARRRGKVAAVLVVRQSGEVADLVDWLWDAAQPDWMVHRLLLTLFADSIEGAVRRGASRARAMTYDRVSETVCRRLGMFRRPGRNAYAIRAHAPSREAELASARWFVTFGDSDGD